MLPHCTDSKPVHPNRLLAFSHNKLIRLGKGDAVIKYDGSFDFADGGHAQVHLEFANFLHDGEAAPECWELISALFPEFV